MVIKLFQIGQIVSGAFLILLILMHSPKGDGLSMMGAASQLFSSQKGAQAGLTKFTAIIGGIFVVISMLLGLKIIH